MGDAQHAEWPEGFRSIDSKNTDYWQWGLNCKLLGFSTCQARVALNGWEGSMTQAQSDLFWEGFVNGRPVPAKG